MSGLAVASADAKRIEAPDAENVALMIAALLAVDPAGLAGVVLRGPADPRRDEWLEALRKILPAGVPWRRVPLGIADTRLLGGLDLTSSLSAGRPIAQQGLLAEADGGIIILPMAERVESQVIARIAAVLDHGALRVEREGITLARDTRFGVVALDEGAGEDEQVTEALSDRLAFRLSFEPFGLQRAVPDMPTRAEIEAARRRLAHVEIPADLPQHRPPLPPPHPKPNRIGRHTCQNRGHHRPEQRKLPYRRQRAHPQQNRRRRHRHPHLLGKNRSH